MNALDILSDEDFFNAMPPGYRFLPSNEELIKDYLIGHLDGQPLPRNRINNADLYQYSPDKLTGRADVRFEEDEKSNKVWYFFTTRSRKYEHGKRPDRKTGDDGFWRPSTKKSEIKDDSGEVIGHVTSLKYYMGTHKAPKKTNWLMQEYTLNDDSPSPAPGDNNPLPQMDGALCKIYKNWNNYKSRSAQANGQQIVPAQVHHQQDEYMPNESTNGNIFSQAVTPGSFQQQVYEEPGSSDFREGQWGTASDDNRLLGSKFGRISIDGFSGKLPSNIFQNNIPMQNPSTSDPMTTGSDQSDAFVSIDDFLENMPLSPDQPSSTKTFGSNQQCNYNLSDNIFQNNNLMQNPSTSNPMTTGSKQSDAFSPDDFLENVSRLSPELSSPKTFGSNQQCNYNLSDNIFQNNTPMQIPSTSNPMTTGSGQQSDVFCTFYNNATVLMQYPTSPGSMPFGSVQQWDALCPDDNFQSNDLMQNQTPPNYPVTFGNRQQQDVFCPSPFIQNNIPMPNPTGNYQNRDAFCQNNISTRIPIKVIGRKQ